MSADTGQANFAGMSGQAAGDEFLGEPRICSGMLDEKD
jgi:hypothetical protein